MIVWSIYFNVLFYHGFECFADFFKCLTITCLSHQAVREVSMHTATVPIKISQWFAMPVNRDTIFFANSFKQVTGHPYFIAGLLSAFCKNLKFPLTGCYFSIYTLNVKARIETSIQMFFNNCTTTSV